jgi:ABC-type amino acid transport substrate-binding protein
MKLHRVFTLVYTLVTCTVMLVAEQAIGSLAHAQAAAHTAPPATTSSIPTIDPAPIRANIAAFAADEFNGRSFRSEEGKRAAQWVAEKLAAAGAKPLVKGADGRESMLVPIGRMPAAAPNVVAWIPPRGSNPSGEFLLVTAHFDHLPPKSTAGDGEDKIYNGADDNASGVCGMIAVAEALKDDALDVGVVFVGFTGEEAGLVGSRAFVEEETVPTARIRGVFNMDMISRQPDGAIRLDGGPKGKPLVDLLVRLAPEVPLEMKVDTHPDWLDRSDQGAFLRVGIPAVLFSCEDHEDYHQVSDHADKVDAVLAAKVASLVAGAVRVYAREMAPRFDRSPVLADDGSQRRTLRVGRTMPNAPYWKPATRRAPDRGLDAAILEAITKATALRVEEKSVPIGGELAALRAGEVDVVLNGVGISADADTMMTASGTTGDAKGAQDVGESNGTRDELLAIPYLGASGVALLVRKDDTITATDLAKKRVAVRAGTAADAWATRQQLSNVERSTESDGSISSKLEKGELDAFIGDLLALRARQLRNPTLRVIPIAREASGIWLRASDETLYVRLIEALETLERADTIRDIEAKNGATTHALIAQDRGQLVAFDRFGTVLWKRPSPHNAHDFAVLSNGNLLVHAAPNRVIEVSATDPTTPMIWEWTAKPVAPYTGAVEIHAFERLPDGNTLVAETGNLRILEINPKGEIVKNVPIQTDRPDSHHDTRRVRKTSAGTYLVCHEPLGLVREYDARGVIVWEYAIPLSKDREPSPGQQGHGTAVFHAMRLPSGNTLIAGGNNNRVLEVNPAKEIVWSVDRDELKDLDGNPIRLAWVTSLQVLPNGNVIIGNTHAGPDQPQLIEVTREKKVVWTFRDFTQLGNDVCAPWCTDLPEATLR